MTAAPVHLVVGGGGGIGRATVARLRAAGASVVLAGRRGDAVEAAAAELDAEPAVVDARDVDAVDALVTGVLGRHGRLDGIANCAGSLLLKPAHRTSIAEWDDVLDTNLRTAFAVVRAAGTAMRKQGGSLVLLSSAAARLGLANHEAIAAAKAGIEGLARSAAASYAPRGIRVNVVAPGLVNTPMTASLTSNEASREASASLHALGRLGEPDDVAAAITWLLDPANTWVTGQVLGVDGGLATVRSRR